MPPGPGNFFGKPFGLLTVYNNGFFGESDGFSSGSDSSDFGFSIGNPSGPIIISGQSSCITYFFTQDGFSKDLFIIVEIFGPPRPPGFGPGRFIINGLAGVFDTIYDGMVDTTYDG